MRHPSSPAAPSRSPFRREPWQRYDKFHLSSFGTVADLTEGGGADNPAPHCRRATGLSCPHGADRRLTARPTESRARARRRRPDEPRALWAPPAGTPRERSPGPCVCPGGALRPPAAHRGRPRGRPGPAGRRSRALRSRLGRSGRRARGPGGRGRRHPRGTRRHGPSGAGARRARGRPEAAAAWPASSPASCGTRTSSGSVLVRDAGPTRSLFDAEDDDVLLWASELRALRAGLSRSPRIDEAALGAHVALHLARRCPPDLLARAQRVPAEHVLVADSPEGRVAVRRGSDVLSAPVRRDDPVERLDQAIADARRDIALPAAGLGRTQRAAWTAHGRLACGARAGRGGSRPAGRLHAGLPPLPRRRRA